MRHLVLILTSALSACVGILILVRFGGTPAIVGGSLFELLAIGLMAPARMDQAKGSIAGLAAAVKDALANVQPPKP